ncbi:unnamed protein product [Leptidea sinapis]|uniref:Secreted protein n=1 Tax=Leptidea sinapis TaxID=189913 RepID=A0A5E4QIS7_9NEOP|nr:unnamed protein product [Leptidea sinapis]
MKGRQLLLSVVLYQVVFIQDAPFMAFLYTRQNYFILNINKNLNFIVYYSYVFSAKKIYIRVGTANLQASTKNWNGYRA